MIVHVLKEDEEKMGTRGRRPLLKDPFVITQKPWEIGKMLWEQKV